VDQLVRRIETLRRERRAVILAHNYQVPEVQDVADFVGDSLDLSRQAASTTAEVIVFCGVHFMAETAAILSPSKTVLLPDLKAGCSLAETITAAQLRAWKAQHPGAVVVSYVNTSAEVKAESDYCCTSGNAEAVIRAIPEDREILFCPDRFLGSRLARMTGRQMHVWPGQCHVHAGIGPEVLAVARDGHPEAEVLVHPECACTLPTLGQEDLQGPNCVVTSTAGMLGRISVSPARTFIVATEIGILHPMRQQSPDKSFLPASEDAICSYMKRITLSKVVSALEQMAPRVTVTKDIAARARQALDRMIAISG
jgi:quinolinate synthase